ncbi:hypothetical protein FO014_14190 [Serratia rhizosphaerae]|uniref:Head binding n=2 Tax=Serratia rhizosphaerae TaxID=2597702 RepID=A0ABX6GP28_9GAMM|nr:phage head-binding domain-containing protein [Serratia rhizosphaerae]QHA88015.1 hypothetical protein FO014_14190 [Serratia rhizosphaerae]
MDNIIPNVVVSMPSQLFTLACAFKAAANGKIYIGEIDKDPTIPEHQIQVYLENEDGTYVPVAQPLMINSGGYPVYNGQIAKFVTVQGHSMAIYDEYNALQFYYSNVLKYDPDQLRPIVEKFIEDIKGPGGASIVGNEYGGSVQDSINAITPEMFGAKGDGKTDDAAALQAAMDYALNNDKRRVVGMGNYTIKTPLRIGGSAGIGSAGVSINLARLRADDTWPANTGLFDATPMIIMGNAAGNDTNIELSIGYIDGAGKADGLQPTGFGFSLTRIHFGVAINCIRVIGTGKQQWSNASVYITGNSWRVNWLGLHLERGTSGTSPINEGWDINIGFTCSNRYGGFLLRGGSQYAKIAGDFDFNGNYVSLLEVDKITGVKRGMKLTNGTTECDVLSFYNYRGKNYIALAENKVVARGASSYKVDDSLSGAPSVIKVLSVATTQTNATGNNFFDIWHDFQGEPFAAINIRAGYCGGVYGALRHTSRIFYNNNFDGRPDNWRGFGVANSGNTLTMYDKARSDSAIATISADSWNIDRRLYLKLRLYEGVPVAKTLPRSSTEFTHIYTFGDADYDKYLDEGSMYEITLKGNFGGTYGRWLIFIKGTNLQVVEEKYNNTVFQYQFTDMRFSLRQSAQPSINVAVNIRRV